MLTLPIKDNETAKTDKQKQASAEQRRRPRHVSTVYKNTQHSYLKTQIKIIQVETEGVEMLH